jgi:transcriptional regulator with PAS, ATPase and Fis domain
MNKPQKTEVGSPRTPRVSSLPSTGLDVGPADGLIETLTDQLCDHITESLEAVERTIERRIIVRVLRKTNGNQTKAAKLLGIKRTTLNYKIKKLRIDGD